MAKPKKKRDLRARLGRTITPKTKGAAPVAPPGAASPPAAGAALPATPTPQGTAGVTPPSGVTPPPSGVAGPPPGIGSGPGGIAAPPFAQPEPAAPVGPTDPFAAAAPAPAEQRVVRLEFDDRLIEDKEVGKADRFKLVIVAGIMAAAGLGVGFFGGSTYETNKIFDRTVRDAQSIYQAVDEASATINAAQRHMSTIVQAAAGNEAEAVTSSVDYVTIAALLALEKPFNASAFTGKNYNALAPNVVHDLFEYLMNIERLWRDFAGLAAMTLRPTAREELDRTANETAHGASTMYGAALIRDEGGMLVGGLVFVEAAGDEAEEGQVQVRASRTGPGRNLDVYHGYEEQIVEEGSTSWVLLVDNARSRGVLSEQTGAFGRYLNRLREIKPLIDQTVEIQGRLLTAISGALTEAGASTTAEGGGD